MKKICFLLFFIASFQFNSFSQTYNYDVNGDGAITVADVTAIYDYLLGIIPADTTETATVTEYTVNGVTFKMVAVHGGTFAMGGFGTQVEDYERPIHQVTLSDFRIGQTEVTQELWQVVMWNNPSNFNGGTFGINLQRPVEFVSWEDCQEFIVKLNQITGKNFRLPTEAEWEYAARGGEGSQGYAYAGSNAISNVAWYTTNSGSATHTVATKAPNELGLYDMSGNVGEWCQDWYNSSYYSNSPTTNPPGPDTGSSRVVRGGNWGTFDRYCRVFSRKCETPSTNNKFVGLRLAL